jgi:transcriptional regulator with XRE-family HTH domain
MKEKKNIIKEDIGRRLSKIRSSLGLSQQRMATLLNTGKMSLNRNERGQNYPNGGTLYELANQFNVSLDWLFLGRGNMFIGVEEVEEPKSEEVKSSDLFERDVEELLDHMRRIPLVRYSVLDHFHRFKIENKAFIDKVISEEKETGE